jgi:tetratricopeptide (TPR) repeat protein
VTLPVPGTAIGRYLVFDLLGQGGMGAVFRAWDDHLDRIVALKLLLPSAKLRADARARFLREARLAARVNHPAVAHVYDVGEHDGTPYIAMEYVPGRQLRLDMREPMQPDRAVFLARQILDGLGEAHRQGVVHRDLKPENVLLSGRDQVKLLDFGLAKPTYRDPKLDVPPTEGLAGTPRYMAPEQIRGGEVDGRTDLYAVGVVLYELLTGAPAHAGDSFIEVARSILEGDPPSLHDESIPSQLASTVEKAMEREPQRRFGSAEEMLAALAGIRGDSRISPAPVRGDAYLPHPRAGVLAARAREQLVGFGLSNAEAAFELAEKAIAIDPAYPLARAILAEAAASVWSTTERDVGWLDRAEAALQEAERLDPALPDIRVARAKLLWNKTFNFPAETVLRELSLALRINPDHVGALRQWASVTAHLGIVELLLPVVERRLDADPNDALMHLILSAKDLQSVDPRGAEKRLEPLLRLDPGYEEVVPWWQYAHARLLQGDLDGANQTLDRLLARHPDDPAVLGLLALSDAIEGSTPSVHAIAEQALAATSSDTHPHHGFHHLALAFSVLGETDRALELLRRAAEEGFPCVPWFEADPFLENLRRTAAGAAYLKELSRRHGFFRREFGVAGFLGPVSRSGG